MTETESRAGGTHPDHGHDHVLEVKVRTLAGHSKSVTAQPGEIVAELTASTVQYFVEKGELEPGKYALTLPRSGEGALDPNATLREVGVEDGDVLVLVNRKPHTDG
jgi:hypothetical protein